MKQKDSWDWKALGYLKNCSRILDAGCGHGRFMLKAPTRTTGIDIDRESIETCKSRNLNARQRNVTFTKLRSRSFDGIHCSHVIEHLNPPEAAAMLREMDRLLKPGGTLVIRSPVLCDGFYETIDHIRPYHPTAIINELNRISTYRTINMHWRHARLFNLIPLPKITGFMLILKKETL